MVHKCFFNEIIAGPSILEIDCRAKRDVNVYITRVATARCGEKPNTIFTPIIILTLSHSAKKVLVGKR